MLLFSKFLIHKSGDNNSSSPSLTFIGHYHDPSNKKFFKNFFYKGEKPLKGIVIQNESFKRKSLKILS